MEEETNTQTTPQPAEAGSGEDDTLEAAIARNRDLDDRLKAAAEKLRGAATAYRDLLTATNPDIPEELIKGEGIEELNSSLERAKDIVAKVKEGLKAEARSTSVPAGAPVRSAPDISSLSPAEKIRYGLSKGGR